MGNGNPEKFLIFQERELSYISGNVNPKVTFRARKIKTPPLEKLNTLNKTPLGKTGCFSNLYYLLPIKRYLCVRAATEYYINLSLVLNSLY